MTDPTDSPLIPQRVLMTTDTVGGVWSYSLDLCRGLGRYGVEVILATMGGPLKQGQRIEAAGVENVQLLESRYKLEWMEEPWDDVEAAGTWLELLEAQFAPDLIHLNGYAHATLPWSAPVIVVAHSDVLTWWEAVRGGQAPSEWHHYAEVVRNGLQAADVVVSPTRAMLDALQRHYGALASARVIYNGRDPLQFPAREKEAFVLSAGRLWDDAKNARALADVAADLGWPVKLAGADRAPEGGRIALRNVDLLGFRAPGEMSELFARASIYALPARYEPFGLTALEAGLAGCALVLGDIPTLRELWGDAAEFVPPDDRTALRRTLSHLISDPERRAELAGRAYRRAGQFTVERTVHEYLAAYAAAARAPQFTQANSAASRA
jgi:glycosyltransferase involved in cell wall biosynthesis